MTVTPCLMFARKCGCGTLHGRSHNPQVWFCHVPQKSKFAFSLIDYWVLSLMSTCTVEILRSHLSGSNALAWITSWRVSSTPRARQLQIVAGPKRAKCIPARLIPLVPRVDSIQPPVTLLSSILPVTLWLLLVVVMSGIALPCTFPTPMTPHCNDGFFGLYVLVR